MKREIIKRYNITYKGYDKLYGEEQKKKIEKIEHYLKKKKILDIGCGTGILEEKMENGGYIIGLDLSEKMIKSAKEKNKRKRWISWIVADAENLPIRERSIEVTAAITVFQNIPNPNKALKEMKRTLKKKGTAITTLMKKDPRRDEVKKKITKTKLKIKREIDEEELKDRILILQKDG